MTHTIKKQTFLAHVCLAFFAITFAAQPLNAITSYRLFENADTGKKVLLLGICHREELAEISQNIIEHFCKFTSNKTFFGDQKENSVHCIYELSDATAEMIRSKKLTSDTILDATVHYLCEWANKHPHHFINFETHELRLDVSTIFNSIIRRFYDRFDEHVKTGRPLGLLKLIANNLAASDDLTLEQCYNYLDECLTQMKTFADEYEQGTPEHQALAGLVEQFEKNLKKLRNIFRRQKNTDLLYCTLLDTCTHSTKEQIIDLVRLMEEKLDYLFADTTYLHKLIQSQRSSDKTMLVLGGHHVKSIANILPLLGHTQTRGEIIIFPVHNKYGLIDYEFIRSKNFYPDIMESFVSFVSPQFEQNRPGFEYHACTRCSKNAKQRCSLCKTAYYCSRDCQVADWQVGHKDICQK